MGKDLTPPNIKPVIKPKPVDLSNVKVPIFVITKDRLDVLKRSINSYHKFIKTPFEIVIHDNGSTYKPLLDYLKELEDKGTKVYYAKNERFYSKIQSLGRVNDSVVDFMDNHSSSPYYVVTDPDVALYGKTPGKILEIYATLLEVYGKNFPAVGPIMRIDNIPDFYPHKARVIKRYNNLHFRMPRFQLNFNGVNYDYYFKRLESTFAIYKRGRKFGIYKKAIRVHAPCDAAHLDWYINPKKMTEDQRYYASIEHDAPFISHWGGQFLRNGVIGSVEAGKMDAKDKKIKELAKQGHKGVIKKKHRNILK